MRRLYVPMAMFVLLSANVLVLNSWDTQPSQIQKIYKIIQISGLSELATMPSNDIIPTFQFALPTIPDSEWEQLRMKYDSANVIKDIADSLRKKFTQDEIDVLYDLLAPLEGMKVEYEYNKPYISNLELSLKYFKALDSVWSLIDKINWEGFDTILAKGKSFNRLFGDSMVLRFDIENLYRFIDSLGKLSRAEKKARGMNDTASSVRQQRPKSLAPDSLLEHNLFSSIDLWAKATEQFLEACKNYLNALQELSKSHLQTLEENKGFDKLLKNLEKKLLEVQKEFEKESKEFQKKYRKEMDKIQKEMKELEKQMELPILWGLRSILWQKEMKELEKQMEQMQNEIDKESEFLPDSSFYKYQVNWEKYFQQLKELFERYQNFFKGYRYFRQNYEQRIIEDLKRRGYIKEE